MPALVTANGENKKIHPSVIQFFKNLGVKLILYKIRTPQTKGKDEVSNKYAQ